MNFSTPFLGAIPSSVILPSVPLLNVVAPYKISLQLKLLIRKKLMKVSFEINLKENLGQILQSL